MNKWVQPIYDRTALDITSRSSKAFFNVADWLRVNGNTEIVNAITRIMLALDVQFDELTAPAITTIPAVADINAFIANIERVRSAVCFPVASGVVELKDDYLAGNSADAPDYLAVNDWERDIYLIREFLRTSAERTVYCGTFDCGAGRTWANRFRRWPGYVRDAYDGRRMPRPGAACGSGLARQNKWRSPYDARRRVARCGSSSCGTGLTRLNSFRRYA